MKDDKKVEAVIQKAIDVMRDEKQASIMVYYDTKTGEPGYLITQPQLVTGRHGGRCMEMLEFALVDIKNKMAKFMQEKYEKAMKDAKEKELLKN